MDLLTPDLGLFFWTLVVFLCVWLILKKFAWKPITSSLNNRADSIAEALNEAKKAREEMAQLKAENEKIIAEAKKERDQILHEAKELKDNILKEAKEEAKTQGSKMIEEAKISIRKERERSFLDLKREVAEIAVNIATKLLKSELSDKEKQEVMVEKYLEETNLN